MKSSLSLQHSIEATQCTVSLHMVSLILCNTGHFLVPRPLPDEEGVALLLTDSLLFVGFGVLALILEVVEGLD